MGKGPEEILGPIYFKGTGKTRSGTAELLLLQCCPVLRMVGTIKGRSLHNVVPRQCEWP